MKAKAKGGPDASRKPGDEGLDYTPAEQVAGGPIDKAPKGEGLGADKGVTGSSEVPGVIKGKGGPKK